MNSNLAEKFAIESRRILDLPVLSIIKENNEFKNICKKCRKIIKRSTIPTEIADSENS